MVIAASLGWNVFQVRQNTLETARIQAQTAYEKDVIYRRWNAGHGGVYVPVTAKTQPNPYLIDTPEREIRTPSGKLLTLINPAYMTRQAHELAEEQYGVRGHITSLTPIRPENAPDPWETKALQAFQRGEAEVALVEEIEDQEYMRLMRPLITEKGCLQCHAAQGYQEGDIRGGISVSVPMEPLWAVASRQIRTLAGGHTILWLLGLGGVVLGTQRLRRSERDRKQVERQIEERQQYLEGVLRAAPDAIVTLDFHNRIVEWNRGAERLFQYSREEVVGQNLDELITNPDVFEESVGFTQIAMGGHEIPSTETVRYQKDGTPVDVIVAVSPILVEDKFDGLVGVYTDITERKRGEERLQRYAVELRQANEEIKQFAYIVSHDLRAPLINLKGFSTELRSALGEIQSAKSAVLPHLDEEQQRSLTLALEEDIPEALHFIESSVNRMDDFINAVLKLSRLGHRELHLETLDMNNLVQETLETVAHQIEANQTTVTVGLLPEIVADRTALKQIVGNLLGNALKYFDPDRPGEIEISAERDDDETLFQIRDNGRGIAADDMPKVFAPFRRIGRQDTPGEGMGLPYVQALVRRHGGRIWCESEPGVGTTFAFTIPNHLEDEEE
jgi:PAS domain S-box-containing protein